MTDLSSWTAYFQDFGQFFNGFLHPFPSTGSLAMVLPSWAIKSTKRPILRILLASLEFYQNTPLQFVIVFYGLPLSVTISSWFRDLLTAVLCVGLYHGAYIAGGDGSGIGPIPGGQMEAALSQVGLPISRHALDYYLASGLQYTSLLDQINRQPIKNTQQPNISGRLRCLHFKSGQLLNGNHIPAFLGAALLYFSLLPVRPVCRKMEQANKKPIYFRGYYGIHFLTPDNLIFIFKGFAWLPISLWLLSSSLPLSVRC